MDLPKFLSLLSGASLWLARSDTFKDKREGIFHQSMKSELDEIYKDLSLKGNIEKSSEIKNSDDFQNYLSSNTYVSCWHQKNEESMVMWEIYGQSENSIALKTTASKLKNSFDLGNVKKYALDKVSYENHDSVNSERNYRQPFFIKRPHFSFEDEVRLYLFARDTKSRSKAPLGYKIKVNISKLIDQIYVHPDAENWFVESVQDLIKKYGLKLKVQKGNCGNQF